MIIRYPIQRHGYRGYGDASETAGQIGGSIAQGIHPIWESIVIGTVTGVSIWFFTNLLSRTFGFGPKGN